MTYNKTSFFTFREVSSGFYFTGYKNECLAVKETLLAS